MKINTVSELIKALKKCDPDAKLITRGNGSLNIVKEPNNEIVYVDIFLIKG